MSYRGRDRRGTLSADGPPSWRLGLAALAVVAAAGAEHVLAQALPGEALRGAAAGLALAAAAVCAVRWGRLGDAAALWLGGGLVPTAADLLLPGALGGAGHLAGAGAALVAAVVPEVDVRQRRRWLVAVPAAAAAVLAPVALPEAAVGLAWGLAAGALAVRGLRDGRPAVLWFAVAAAGLALGSPLTAAVAIGVALAGALRGVGGAIAAQRDRLLDATVDTRRAAATTDAAAYARERSAHDAHNALTALGGAIYTLERHRDRLDEATREQLTAALGRELERLQDLVGDEGLVAPGMFAVMAALRPLRAAEHGPDEWDVPEELTAFGRVGDTGQVVRLLLESPRTGEPCVVRSSRDGDRVQIEVRGVRADAVTLQVAEALVTAQGGRLVGLGGPGYAIELPASPPG